MKTYWDLSEKERADLTPEDVERFVDAELMLKGVLAARPPVLEPVDEPEPAKRTMFAIKTPSLYGARSELAVATLEQAKAILAMAPVVIERRYFGGITLDVAVGKNLQIETVDLVDQDDARLVEMRLQKAGLAKTANERATEEYKRTLKVQEDALTGLWSDWRDCRAEAASHRRVVETFDDYAKTAGDKATAAKFLLKVFPRAKVAAAAAWFGVEIVLPNEYDDVPDALPLPEPADRPSDEIPY